jgi:hypothetical protein
MIAANPQVTIAAIWELLADENGVTVAYPILRTYVSNRRDPTGHSQPARHEHQSSRSGPLRLQRALTTTAVTTTLHTSTTAG